MATMQDASKLVISVVSAILVLSAFVVIFHHEDTASSSRTISDSPTTSIFADVGNAFVSGYSCRGITSNRPCDLEGGRCSGSKCKCKDGYSGYPCDWGPKIPSDDWSYSNYPPQNKQEALRRIAMAYGFSNAVYKSADQMTTACPAFAKKSEDGFAEGTDEIHLLSCDASTHAGASMILPGSHSPSGRGEALFGFRGTEFVGAIKEIQSGTGQFKALLTVLTDLNIARKDVNWRLKNGTEIDLGYVHMGFWNAVKPFMADLLKNATDYVEGSYWYAGKGHGEEPIINIVGHSLGGALANIFASILRVVVPEARIYITTFGSPRVGSATWVKHLAAADKTHILRVVAGDDVVSLVPTSVGLLDSVMHAGPQLTVGWNHVEDSCRSLVEITSQFSLLLENNFQNNYILCAVDSVLTFHINYSYSLNQYLRSQGHEYEWCDAKQCAF